MNCCRDSRNGQYFTDGNSMQMPRAATANMQRPICNGQYSYTQEQYIKDSSNGQYFTDRNSMQMPQAATANMQRPIFLHVGIVYKSRITNTNNRLMVRLGMKCIGINTNQSAQGCLSMQLQRAATAEYSARRNSISNKKNRLRVRLWISCIGINTRPFAQGWLSTYPSAQG